MEAQFAAAFLIGLLGGGHCVGMCGGIVGALTVQAPRRRHAWDLHLFYSAGRIASYAAAGAIMGMIGGAGRMFKPCLAYLARKNQAKYNVPFPTQSRKKLSMKAISFLLVLAVVSTVAVAQPLPAGHPPMGTKSEGKGVPEAQLPQKAKVLSSIDAGEYTYLEVTQNKKALWLAGTKVTVKKGDVIRFDNGMVMTNFNSKTLKRTFASVTFVNRVVVTSEKE